MWIQAGFLTGSFDDLVDALCYEPEGEKNRYRKGYLREPMDSLSNEILCQIFRFFVFLSGVRSWIAFYIFQ